MSKENRKPDNPLAFPNPASKELTANGTEGQDGMTLRDFFAAQVLSVFPVIGNSPGFMAERSYIIADAMLKQREL